jgi:hypothetical protein
MPRFNGFQQFISFPQIQWSLKDNGNGLCMLQFSGTQLGSKILIVLNYLYFIALLVNHLG